MSHFYGVLKGTRGEATRCGDARKGMHVTAASWVGAIRVELYVDAATGRDMFNVYQTPWQGAGFSKHLASGELGKP
jgi:hypothetical protein